MINTSQIISKLSGATGTTVDNILDILVMAGKPIQSDDAGAVLNATANSPHSGVKGKAIQILSQCTDERMAIDSILSLAFDGCTAVKGKAILALLSLGSNKATQEAMSMIGQHEFDALDMEVVEAAAQVDIEMVCAALDQMSNGTGRMVRSAANIAMLKLSWTHQHAATKYIIPSQPDSKDTIVFKARIMGKVHGPPCEATKEYLLSKVDKTIRTSTVSGIETVDESEQEIMARIALNCRDTLNVIELDKHSYSHALEQMEEMILSGKHEVSELEEVRSIYSFLVQAPLEKGWGRRVSFCAKMGWVDVLSYAVDMVSGSKQEYFYTMMKEAMKV